MSKLFSSDHIISVLRSYGFIKISQKGSHVKLRSGIYTVIVPHPKKEIPLGTFLSILKQSGLSRENF